MAERTWTAAELSNVGTEARNGSKAERTRLAAFMRASPPDARTTSANCQAYLQTLSAISALPHE